MSSIPNRLKSSWHRSDRLLVRIVLGTAWILIEIVLAAVVFIGPVSIIPSEFIQWFSSHRLEIWLGITVLLIIGFLFYELYQTSKQLAECHIRIDELRKKEDEAIQKLQSYVRALDDYRQSVYNSLFFHLDRILLLASMQERWENAGARVKKTRIAAKSDAEEIDQEYALLDRMTVVINIGSDDGVVAGMQFWIVDSSIDLNYGRLIVKEVYAKGASCRLEKPVDPGFWREPLELSRNKKAGEVEMSENRIVPNLPPPLKAVPPDLAKRLRSVILLILDSYGGEIP